MDPTVLFALAIFVTVALFGFLIYFINSKFSSITEKKDDETLTKWLDSMQNTMDLRLKNVQGTMDDRLKHVQTQLHQTTDVLNKRVAESSENMNQRLDQAANVIGKVQKELGSMSEIGRGMKDLQDFLKSPKLRGNIGEEVLKDLLEQMIPADNYILQHTFKTGDRVDALLKVEEGYISVDSKFPMENFTSMMQADTSDDRESARKQFVRDVKKHIDDISKKYILPGEGTVDFALMYIPSEAIYYEVVVNNSELGKYSWSKRVLPVSPNVFYSYLKAILIGLEGKKIESRAKEILSTIRSIKEDAGKYADTLRVLNKHISNAKNMGDEAVKNFERLDNRIGSLDNIGRISGSETDSNVIESQEPLENTSQTSLLNE